MKAQNSPKRFTIKKIVPVVIGLIILGVGILVGEVITQTRFRAVNDSVEKIRSDLIMPLVVKNIR